MMDNLSATFHNLNADTHWSIFVQALSKYLNDNIGPYNGTELQMLLTNMLVSLRDAIETTMLLLSAEKTLTERY